MILSDFILLARKVKGYVNTAVQLLLTHFYASLSADFVNHKSVIYKKEIIQ